MKIGKLIAIVALVMVSTIINAQSVREVMLRISAAEQSTSTI